MKKDEIIPYNENIFSKIKNKILSLFKKKQPTIINKENNGKQVDKEELMAIYEKIKTDNIHINELDTDMIYKIMLLLNEEIDMVNARVNKEINEIRNKIENIRTKIETT